MNQTLQSIYGRYSCRAYTGEMPDEEKIQAIIKAAIQSPSSANRQPWQVIVLRNKELLAELEADATEGIAFSEPHKKAYEMIKAKNIKVYNNAPCLMVITKEQNYPEADLDCGIVCQSIAIAAQSLGLASCINGVTPMVQNTDRMDYYRERLQIPDNHDIAISVTVGIAEQAGSPRKANQNKATFVN
ncbi:MAG: nitroreductase family protein [Lacrimispora sphenoides]